MNSFLIVSSILLWLVVVFNLFLTLALIRRINQQATSSMTLEGLAIGESAPRFVAETLQGPTLQSQAYQGKPTIMVFIGPECSHCLKALPLIKQLQPKAAQAAIEFVLVSDGNHGSTQVYFTRHQLHANAIIAPRGVSPLLDEYKVGGVPFYYLISPDGLIQAFGIPGDQGWHNLLTLAQSTSQKLLNPDSFAISV